MSWNYQNPWSFAFADFSLNPLDSHSHHHCLPHCPHHFLHQVPFNSNTIKRI
jgi:hypothetical protein